MQCAMVIPVNVHNLTHGLRTTSPKLHPWLLQKAALIDGVSSSVCLALCSFFFFHLLPREPCRPFSTVGPPRLLPIGPLYTLCSLSYFPGLGLHTSRKIAKVSINISKPTDLLLCGNSCVFLEELPGRHKISAGQARWGSFGEEEEAEEGLHWWRRKQEELGDAAAESRCSGCYITDL